MSVPEGRTFAVPARWQHLLLSLLLFASLPFGTGCCPAQTLARPGWAGFGVAVAPWWQTAVFYRVDSTRFQASGSASSGDLPGITLRLGYLRALGVDAVVLDSPGSDGRYDPETLEELMRAASRQNVRILPTITFALAEGSRSNLLGTVHEWLSEGAGGVFFPDPSPGVPGEEAVYGNLVTALQSLLRATPGERVLLTDPAPFSASSGRGNASPSIRRGLPAGLSGRLITGAELPVSPGTAAQLRAALTAAVRAGPGVRNGLLRFSADPSTGSPDAVAYAAALLASRGAALFDFGDEIGLDTYPAGAARHRTAPLPVMQWTPANVQQAPIVRVDAAPTPAPGQATPFGAYRPFIRPPPRGLTGGVPAGPQVSLDRNLPPPAPDPNTLPGFTAGVLPVEPLHAATVNVATEERDPGSVLNAYRTLVALRASHPALQAGEQVLLDHDAENTLVFVRKAPPGARSPAPVVVAANLGDTPVVLALAAELAHLGLRSGRLRTLFSYGSQTGVGETAGILRLPPHAVFLGEFAGTRRATP